MEQPPPQPDQPPDPQPDQRGEGLDLLTVALLVFFVSLILIVGALLFLPAIV
jgi:hypothetical protein